MRLRQAVLVVLVIWAPIAGAAWRGQPAMAQEVKGEALASILLDAADLPGFVRVRPAAPIPAPKPGSFLPGEFCADSVWPNVQLATLLGGRPGVVSRADRVFYSPDSTYFLGLSVWVCDSPATAAQELGWDVRSSSGVFRSRLLASGAPLADECWSLLNRYTSSIKCRAGRVVARATGRPMGAVRAADVAFPPASIDGLVQSLLVRAARQPDLTGVQSQQVAVTVMGKPLPAGAAVQIGERVYVRTREAMAAAGWKHEWDAKTGVLTLAHPSWTRKVIALRALPANDAPDVSVPLWSDNGEPMMLLADLAAQTHATLSRDAQGAYQVTGLQ